MGGKSSSDQQTQQQGQTEPWGPTKPVLQGILSGVQSQLGNYQPTGQEQQALSQLSQNVQGVPNFAPQASDITGQFLTGDPSGLLRPGLESLNTALNPIATGDLDPTKTPGIQNLLATIKNDVTNSVNGMFAGAGRDLSGLNQQALGRGLSQGLAAPLLNQYNQNVQNRIAAAGGMYDASGNTANALGGNQTQGFNLATSLPGLAAAGPMGVLAASQAARALPLENLGMLANLTVPIAGLGQQSSGSSYTHGTQTASPMQTALGWTGVFKNLFSDRRLKTDIQQVGELFDGTPVYRYRYVGDIAMRIGLMADEVIPEAVGEAFGYKTVDYELATNRAVGA